MKLDKSEIHLMNALELQRHTVMRTILRLSMRMMMIVSSKDKLLLLWRFLRISKAQLIMSSSALAVEVYVLELAAISSIYHQILSSLDVSQK